jgi:chemotaxis protein MotB
MGGKRKFRRRHGDVDDWLMTYADMITLLLCFFAVFLSVSVPKKEKFERASQEVRHQFGTPDVVAGNFPPRQLPKNFSDEEEAEIIYGALPSIVGSYEENKGAYVDKKGDRITQIEMNSAPFFASGSATLSEDGKKILGGDLLKLFNDKYKDYTITVEGHTDDNPISTPQFPSNWELSTARAAAVVRYFLSQGIDGSRLRAAGYADVFPKVANRDNARKPIPANQAQNRRVIIKLEKIEKEQQKR